VVLPATSGAFEPEVWQYQLLFWAHAINALESDDARKPANKNTAAIILFIFSLLFILIKSHQFLIWRQEVTNNLENCAAYSIYFARPPAIAGVFHQISNILTL
jgi:hypothetical protein